MSHLVNYSLLRVVAARVVLCYPRLRRASVGGGTFPPHCLSVRSTSDEPGTASYQPQYRASAPPLSAASWHPRCHCSRFLILPPNWQLGTHCSALHRSWWVIHSILLYNSVLSHVIANCVLVIRGLGVWRECQRVHWSGLLQLHTASTLCSEVPVEFWGTGAGAERWQKAGAWSGA